MTTMNVKVLHVSKTTAQWADVTDVISKGLLCVEFTADGKTKLKVGNGTDTYADLPYAGGDIDITKYSTTEEVNNAISEAVSVLGNLMTVKGIVEDTTKLPTTNNKVGDVYLVGVQGETTDSFSEYVWTENNKWEFMGRVATEVSLDAYATKVWVTEQLTGLNDAKHTHTNKDILDATTASFTTELETKLNGLKNTTVDGEISDVSENPVQNKVIKTALDDKIDKTDTLVLNCTL